MRLIFDFLHAGAVSWTSDPWTVRFGHVPWSIVSCVSFRLVSIPSRLRTFIGTQSILLRCGPSYCMSHPGARPIDHHVIRLMIQTTWSILSRVLSCSMVHPITCFIRSVVLFRTVVQPSCPIKVSIAAQKFATTDCKGSDTTWELRMWSIPSRVYSVPVVFSPVTCSVSSVIMSHHVTYFIPP